MEKLLIAEDDSVSRTTLEFVFKKGGYDVSLVSDGLSAFDALTGDDPPLIAVLDILMPGMSGIEVCQRVRLLRFTIPPYIIMLTVKGGREDILRGLDAGADDYVTKPFDLEELQARVRVWVRMVEVQRKLANKVSELERAVSRVSRLQGLLRQDAHVYEFGPFRLEAAERRLLREGETMPLNSKMFDLLLFLVQNSGHLIEKEEIMREVWPTSIVEDNNLTVHISALRKVLGESHGHHGYIETVPKRGYRFKAGVRELRGAADAIRVENREPGSPGQVISLELFTIMPCELACEVPRANSG